ncbi:SDR family oxidoreductase [Flavisolibacter tropicus]|uniref:3-beta hydroxysteroid dehydrogenase n=1 Tax=Flavisolibacter tropicus TaxID=1492898 RepID=A0A172TXX3_9BACT|nr:SDR family oxidoreductase [Flavisolibacter tropicus]ANE51939.1 3-beta hydroxysteroid dehydrogenase [Flavisolibacter tropicus]
MKVFVTGASGFIGSAVVKELISAGHQVIGLARTDSSAKTISDADADVLMGSLEDLDILKQGASQADGVIHTAFIHDFTQYAKANEADTAAINAMGEALMGTSKPLVVTAGILGLPSINGIITEDSAAQNSPRSSEATAMALAEKGVNASVVRLPPSVHDKGDKGFVPFIIQQARKNGVSAYPGEGNNRWPAVHRLDAAKVFQLAVEKGAKGALYNVIGDRGIEVKRIAELIGTKLNLPVASLVGEEAREHFEWMVGFIGFDSPATSFKTQERLGWKPTHIGLLEDMQQNYF